VETDAWTLIRYLHLLALAFFVGGQLLLVAAVVPVLRGDESTMRAVARRFGLGSLVALGVLVATGVALASHFSRWGDDTLNAKLAVLVLVGVLTGLHIASPHSRAVSIAVFASSLLVVWLGVALAH
jgi:putative copper export protein